MASEPISIRDELLCQGSRVKLYRRLVEYEGKLISRDVVAFGEAAVIVPVKSENRLVFVKQWRAPLRRWIIELPAGRVEQGEEPLIAAKRELEEETGFIAEKWELLGSFSVAPGYSDEVLTFFLAENLRYVGEHPEIGELVETVEMTPEEYISQASKGFGDLKTMTGVLLYLNMKKGYLRL
ncbi:MAG: NUDIX hydrolase [Infirmifilum sp.]